MRLRGENHQQPGNYCPFISKEISEDRVDFSA